MLRVITVVVAALVALSACSSDPAPSAPSPKAATAAASASATAPPTSSKPKVDLAHIEAKAVLGDFATLDSCTLAPPLDLPAKYQKSGLPMAQAGYQVDECWIPLTVAPHHTADVWFGRLATVRTALASGAAGRLANAGGGLTVVQGDADADYCETYLFFADGLAMLIQAATDAGATKAELCMAARDLALAIAAHLRAGKDVGHLTVPASSLRLRDACALLTASTARTVPSLGAVRRFGDFPAHHTCTYEDDRDQAVTLDFVRVTADLDLMSGLTKTTVAGRASASRRGAGPDGTTTCELITGYTAGAGDETVEGVSLTVRRTGGAGSLCADTKTLAATVWAKLPKL